MRKVVQRVVTLVTALLLVLMAACIPAPEEVIPTPTPTPEPTPAPTAEPEPAPTVAQGIIEIRVTDPPPPGVSSAYVTLTKIEVHQASDNVSDNASGWITIISGNSTFNLFEIINEADVLGSENVTAGKYTQIRMEVIEVKGLLSDNMTPYTATVPSGKLRIVRPFNVDAGITTVLTLDFDGDKSLVMTGKEDKVLFKPVVKLLVSGAPVAVETAALAALEIATASLLDGVVGEEYEAEVEATGGTGSYTWSIIPDGDLPDGLELDPDDGGISGTPEAGSEGDYTFTIQVEDDSAQTRYPGVHHRHHGSPSSFRDYHCQPA